jgi:DNA-binding transcriptional LysR family regulator
VDLEHLRTAVSLLTLGTVNRTAAELGIAPSSVSDRIRGIERSLGRQLFVRTARGMRATPAARIYLSGVAAALGQLDEAADEFRRDGRFVLASQATIAHTLLPDVLSRIEAPVHVVVSADRQVLLDDLARGAADAVVILDRGSDIGGLGFAPPRHDFDFLDVREVPLLCVSGPSHPLAGRSVTADTLREGAVMIGREERCSFWMATSSWLGPSTDMVAAGGLAQVIDLAARGSGVAVLPGFAVEEALAEGRLVEVHADAPVLQLRLVWSRSRADTVRRVLYTLSRHLTA